MPSLGCSGAGGAGGRGCWDSGRESYIRYEVSSHKINDIDELKTGKQERDFGVGRDSDDMLRILTFYSRETRIRTLQSSSLVGCNCSRQVYLVHLDLPLDIC